MPRMTITNHVSCCRIVPVILLLSLLSAALTGCGEHPQIAQRRVMLIEMQQMVQLLESIKTPEDAKVHGPALIEIQTRIDALNAEIEQMEPLTEEQMVVVKESINPLYQDLNQRFQQEMLRIGRDPELSTAMGAALTGMKVNASKAAE